MYAAYVYMLPKKAKQENRKKFHGLNLYQFLLSTMTKSKVYKGGFIWAYGSRS